MAEHRYGSTVIAHQGQVLGIFTVDALRVLAELTSEKPSTRKEQHGSHRSPGHR